MFHWVDNSHKFSQMSKKGFKGQLSQLNQHIRNLYIRLPIKIR